MADGENVSGESNLCFVPWKGPGPLWELSHQVSVTVLSLESSWPAVESLVVLGVYWKKLGQGSFCGSWEPLWDSQSWPGQVGGDQVRSLEQPGNNCQEVVTWDTGAFTASG